LEPTEEDAVTTTTESITETAQAFFDACETGKGWAECRPYCTSDASFAAQAEPLAEMTTLEQYTDWMKGLLAFVPDGRYAVKSFATDHERNSVAVYGVFSGTHSADGGPMPPTGKSTNSDYVYVMEFSDGKISHMTKIWNASWAMKELGWI
jgi:predicted ester cyclase